MVVRYANPLINTTPPVNIGNVRIGTTAETALSITNNVPDDGYSEALIATAGAASPGVTASGAFGSLAPTATDNTSIKVGIDTSTAGAKSGMATIEFQSDGTAFSGGVITNLAPQAVAVQGNVFRLANPTVNTPSINLAARVGDASPVAAVGLTNTSPDIYTEGLMASLSTASIGFGAVGLISNLAAQDTDAATLAVNLGTGAAGTFAGTATLALASTGTGITGAAAYPLSNQDVNLSGKVYTPAAGQITSATLDFGIVHKGDSVAAKALTVKNDAPVTALNDVLTGSFSGAGGPFTASGHLSGVTAQASNGSSLSVALNTSAAGVFNDNSARVSFKSHNDDMTDLELGPVAINLVAQINNYANPVFQKYTGSGSLTVDGLQFTLNFGNIDLDSYICAGFRLLNDVTGPADLLQGAFIDNTPQFETSGFNSFTGITAGGYMDDLMVSWTASHLGSFSESIVLQALGYNPSGYSEAFSDITLVLKGNVIASGPSVPEPMTGMLILTGLAGIAVIRKRPLR
jgi:hypothetical protein